MVFGTEDKIISQISMAPVITEFTLLGQRDKCQCDEKAEGAHRSNRTWEGELV